MRWRGLYSVCVCARAILGCSRTAFNIAGEAALNGAQGVWHRRPPGSHARRRVRKRYKFLLRRDCVLLVVTDAKSGVVKAPIASTDELSALLEDATATVYVCSKSRVAH